MAKNTKRKFVILFFLLICFAASLFSILAYNNTKAKNQLRYILISSQEIPHVNDFIRTQIKNLCPDTHETYLEYSSKEARRYIKELSIKFVPCVIYNKSVKTNNAYPSLVLQGVLVEVRGHYIIPERWLTRKEIMLLERKREPNTLYIIKTRTRSFPGQAEKRLKDFIKENKLDIQIKNKDTGAAQAIIKEHFYEPVTLGIKSFPPFLWENIYLIQSLEWLRQHKPFNIRRAEATFVDIESFSGPVVLDFFYGKDCRRCFKLKDNFLSKVEAQYKDKIIINYHDISDPDKLALQFAMEEEYGLLGGSLPEIFLPTEALEGELMIRSNLVDAVERILRQKNNFTTDKVDLKGNPVLDRFSAFSPAVVVLSGLVDGIINPCAFATLVFFISLLNINNYHKNKIIYIGSAFILGVFLTYLALGMGFFQAFKKLQIFSFLSKTIYYAIACVAFGLGIYNLWEYIRYRRTGQTKSCSLRFYNLLRKLVDGQKVIILLIIGAFINGFVIALLESACTGQIYLPAIAFVMKMPNLRLNAFFYLALFNLSFILPLVAVFVLAYKAFLKSFLLSVNLRSRRVPMEKPLKMCPPRS